MFHIFNTDVSKQFVKDENIVFKLVTVVANKVTSNEQVLKDQGMVNTKKDFEQLYNTHIYLPILGVAPLHIKIAYLYDCLNYERGISRDNSFLFMWRTIGDTDWKEWFIVNPYKDSIYSVSRG